MPLCRSLRQVSTGIDARVNVKHAFRWLQALARLLVLSTFINDAAHIGGDYAGQVETVERFWGGGPFPASLLPFFFVLTQSTGVLLILSSYLPQTGCVVLIVWTGMHPFFYRQETNVEFMLESVTVAGGLLILLSSERAKSRSHNRLSLPTNERQACAECAEGDKERTLLAGRVCVSAVFVYYTAKMMYERVASLEADVHVPWFTRTAAYATDSVLMLLLAVVTGLIIVGIKSRWCALLLAMIMACAALYKHPWYISMWQTDKHFHLDAYVVGLEKGLEVDSSVYTAHERYFFFQQLSTAGALLQLVVHGPGKLSVDEADGPVSLERELTAKGCD